MLIIGVSTVSVGEADVTGQPDVFFAGAFPKTSKIQKHKHPQKLLGLAWFASQLWRTVYGKNIPKPEAVQPTQNIKKLLVLEATGDGMSATGGLWCQPCMLTLYQVQSIQKRCRAARSKLSGSNLSQVVGPPSQVVASSSF